MLWYWRVVPQPLRLTLVVSSHIHTVLCLLCLLSVKFFVELNIKPKPRFHFMKLAQLYGRVILRVYHSQNADKI